jgi:Terminase large subunit, T4likevirus-type, N-terminal
VNPLRADFARRVNPDQLAAVVGLDPLDDWQLAALESTSRRILMIGGRQVGKSSVCGVMAVRELLYHRGSTTLLLAPSLRQAQEVYLKALTLYRALGRPVPADAETSLTLTLANHSRLICIPGSNASGIRGFTADLVIVDEAARVSDEAYAACRAMVAVSAGSIVLLSSPAGRSGFLWNEWNGSAAWERYTVRSDECPRITPEFLAAERKSLPGYLYAAEHECVFAPLGASSLFSDSDLKNMVDPRIEPLGGDWG